MADAPAPAPATKKYHRSRSDRKIAGVCGGLAQYFGWDPLLVRVLFVAAAFVTLGGALIAYILLWALADEQ